ncbi:efflux RND transporter periplasmic adaptor subunit [Methylobrevis pamukkalensis]|uniref:Multidrug resistance protein MdtA n=1 Tax=Methylobrevis pamukkalensis TaxID=1439726 RepID=A0A1E3H6C9_9HYPH|nr:efflux RND transporter periplasmic adaptor subunit [Methylobrevis pamukkalensis]ODN71889.1 Multidrug resistance protein MdtA precursor [Methylobrevis pamukkalensis]
MTGRWTSAALLMPLLLAACQEAEVVKAPDPVVRAEVVRVVSMAESRSYTGVVTPRRETPVAFRVGGKMTARTVDVGDRVAAGQLLATLDEEDFRLSLESAEAELAAARANLAQAETDQKRYTDLAKGGIVSRSTDEQRRLATDEAQARLEKAEKSVHLARNQLDYARLVAAGDGVVTAVDAEPGEVVTSGRAILTIAPLGETEVEVAIPESRLADLDGASASVDLWSGGRALGARLREISPRADATSRTYRARFTLVDPGPEVRLGMTATLTLTRGEPGAVIRLPSTAILDEGAGPVVFVVAGDGHTLRKTPVSIRRFGASDVLVAGGIGDGATVVTLGVNKLQDGDAVRVALDEARG